ncbi:MAG: FtsX-like permease family protein [Pseudomonadota bacterium]
MYWNYFITAIRNQLKHPGFSALSIFGLMLGLCVTTLVFLYVWQETHYDSHLPGAEQLYVVDVRVDSPGRAPQLLLAAPGPLAERAQSLSGVVEVGRLWQPWYTISIEDRIEFNTQIGAVDANLPSLLALDMVEGDIGALSRPETVLISISMAERLFGNTEAMGRAVTFGGNRDQVVSGVYRDMPEASHLALDILVSLDAPAITDRGTQFETNWQSMAVLTYIRLSEMADPAVIEQTLRDTLWANTQPPDGIGVQDYLQMNLEPLLGLHLNGKPYAFRPKGEAGNPTQLWIASTIAFLIMLVASINTVNMATARSSDRAKEVAMRKVVGASRAQLVTQFIGESALLVLLATLGALVLAELTSGPVGYFVGRSLSLEWLLQPSALITFALLLLVVTLLSGLYPAFVLARHRPHAIFQPMGAAGSGRFWSLRNALVVFQFCASVTLIILAATVWSQVRFMQSADLGFEAADIVMVSGIRRGPAQTIALTSSLDQALEGQPGIRVASAAHSSPSWDYAEQGRVRFAEAAASDSLTLDRLAVDMDFFSLLGIGPVAGRVFSEDFGSDQLQWDLEQRQAHELPVVLNQLASNSLGLANPDDALGRALMFEPSPGVTRPARVVGVVPDFHFKSLKTPIAPMLFFPDPSEFNLMMVGLEPGNRVAGMASLERAWDQVFPDQGLSWGAMDVSLVDQYTSESRQSIVLVVLAGIAVLIALLGLFGLLAHVIAGRRKEISLRKVMGAETLDLLRLFLWQFSRPVLIAIVIAWPLAWILASRWLDGFAYRIELSPVLFFAAALIALGFCWSLTTLQVLRVSHARPALVLRAQ